MRALNRGDINWMYRNTPPQKLMDVFFMYVEQHQKNSRFDETGLKKPYSAVISGKVTRRDYYTWNQFVDDLTQDDLETPAQRAFERNSFRPQDFLVFWMNHRCQTVVKTIFEVLHKRRARKWYFINQLLKMIDANNSNKDISILPGKVQDALRANGLLSEAVKGKSFDYLKYEHQLAIDRIAEEYYVGRFYRFVWISGFVKHDTLVKMLPVSYRKDINSPRKLAMLLEEHPELESYLVAGLKSMGGDQAEKTLLALNNGLIISSMHNTVSKGKAPRAVSANALFINLMDKFNEYREKLGLNKVDIKDFIMGSYDGDTELEFAEAKRLLYAQHLFQKNPKLGMLFIATYVFMRGYTLGAKLFSLGEDVFWIMDQWLLGLQGKCIGSGHNYEVRVYLVTQTDTFDTSEDEVQATSISELGYKVGNFRGAKIGHGCEHTLETANNPLPKWAGGFLDMIRYKWEHAFSSLNVGFGIKLSMFLLGFFFVGLAIGALSLVENALASLLGINSFQGLATLLSWMVIVPVFYYSVCTPLYAKLVDEKGWFRASLYIVPLIVFAAPGLPLP